jgi:hypothetical protein
MRHRISLVLATVIAFLCISPTPGLAQWEGWFSWGTQGSYVHQTAHLLFAGAMFFFIRQMRREDLQRYRGFRFLIWGSWFLAFWNLDAFVGHAVEWSLSPVIMGQGAGERLAMENFYSWLFYITKLDHFILLVPAFYLFYRGIKALAQEPRVIRP